MSSIDEIDAILKAAKYPPGTRHRSAVFLAESILTPTETLLAALVTVNLMVDDKRYGGILSRGQFEVLTLTTERLVAILASNKHFAVPIGEVQSVTPINKGRQFTVTTKNNGVLTVSGRPGFYHKYGHVEAVVAFREQVESAIPA